MAALVKRDANWVPSRREYTLYMRPFMFASEPFLGVRAPQEVDYCVIASPSGPYFPGGVKPVSIWVEDKWFRTGPGGTGFAKCGGNYAASLLGEYKGIENGCEQVCFVDAATKTTPIGRFKSEKFDVTVADGGSGELTVALRDELLGIQLGEVEDPHNWMWKVC